MRPFRFASNRGFLSTGGAALLMISSVAMVVGTGFKFGEAQARDGITWIQDRANGEVAKVNTSSGKVELKVAVPAEFNRPNTRLITRGNEVYLHDPTTGALARVDADKFKVSKRKKLAKGSDQQVVAGDNDVFVIDRPAGRVQRLDGRTLQPVGEPMKGPKGMSNGKLDDEGSLWVTASETGEVIRLDASGDGLEEKVRKTFGKPGDRLEITKVNDGMVVTNVTTGEQWRIDRDGEEIGSTQVVPNPDSATSAGDQYALEPDQGYQYPMPDPVAPPPVDSGDSGSGDNGSFEASYPDPYEQTYTPAESSGPYVPVNVNTGSQTQVTPPYTGPVGGSTEEVPPAQTDPTWEPAGPAVTLGDRMYFEASIRNDRRYVIVVTDLQGRYVKLITPPGDGPYQMILEDDRLIINDPDANKASVIDVDGLVDVIRKSGEDVPTPPKLPDNDDDEEEEPDDTTVPDPEVTTTTGDVTTTTTGATPTTDGPSPTSEPTPTTQAPTPTSKAPTSTTTEPTPTTKPSTPTTKPPTTKPPTTKPPTTKPPTTTPPATTPTTRLAAPGQPQGMQAAPGDASLAVAWAHGAGGAIANQQVIWQGQGCGAGGQQGLGPQATSFTIGALANGCTYTVTVRAANAAGAAEASTQGRPTATTPGAPGTPTSVNDAANGRVNVTFGPADPQGTTISNYVVTATGGGHTAQVQASGGGAVFPAAAQGGPNTLQFGITYSFTVQAVATTGVAGPPSGSSGGVLAYGYPTVSVQVGQRTGPQSWSATAGVTWRGKVGILQLEGQPVNANGGTRNDINVPWGQGKTVNARATLDGQNFPAQGAQINNPLPTISRPSVNWGNQCVLSDMFPDRPADRWHENTSWTVQVQGNGAGPYISNGQFEYTYNYKPNASRASQGTQWEQTFAANPGTWVQRAGGTGTYQIKGGMAQDNYTHWVTARFQVQGYGWVTSPMLQVTSPDCPGDGN